MINIYRDKRVIKLPYPIYYHDISKICKELNLPENIGNTITLPIDTEWYRLMENDLSYNITDDEIYHYKRRILFHMKGFSEEITTFSTDYSVNSDSVLTYSDVQNIMDAVCKINRDKKQEKKNKKIDDILLDPVTLDILRDPLIASDGITYSKATLRRLFDSPNPISPMTREQLTLINGKYGLQNRKIQEIIEHFEL